MKFGVFVFKEFLKKIHSADKAIDCVTKSFFNITFTSWGKVNWNFGCQTVCGLKRFFFQTLFVQKAIQ
ncbi:hypothetical protein NPIL_10681 [Nephila pilipes]|uniref:Uncharacterized protein n=1 Tax=Nephila pilipes TaxID=299642 RepID=A0A8X6P390_NEPPI|nr:hypothetical protein NPIL_10681 [Nephila pilipes]